MTLIAKSARLVNLSTGEETDLTDCRIALHTTADPGFDQALPYIPPRISFTTNIALERINAEGMALMFGVELVDASIWWEPHLVRGEN